MSIINSEIKPFKAQAYHNGKFVEVTDASGRPFYIIANRAGNFYTTHAFRRPLRRVRAK